MWLDYLVKKLYPSVAQLSLETGISKSSIYRYRAKITKPGAYFDRILRKKYETSQRGRLTAIGAAPLDAKRWGRGTPSQTNRAIKAVNKLIKSVSEKQGVSEWVIRHTMRRSKESWLRKDVPELPPYF